MGTPIKSARPFVTRVWLSMLVIAVSVAALPAADHVSGKSGGVLVVGQTSEPKTFNPAMAVDQATRDVLSVLSADLVHINRLTLRTELALAKSCVMFAERAGAATPEDPNQSDLVRQIRTLREELNWYYHRVELEQLSRDERSAERLDHLQAQLRSREHAFIRILRDMLRRLADRGAATGDRRWHCR